MANVNQLERQLSELLVQVKALQAERDRMALVLQALGYEGAWLSPAKAAAILGRSKDRLTEEIEVSESLRAAGKQGDVIYGVHYVDDRTLKSSTPAWKINVVETGKVLKIPPDQRKVL